MFVKTYSFMSDESREWNAAEYIERKLLLKRLTGLEAQLAEPELLELRNCVAGKVLDIRENGAKQMYFLWQEQQSFCIDDFRKGFTNQKMGDLLRKLRESQGATKADTALLIGVSTRTYSDYENGRRTAKGTKILLTMILFGCFFE